MRPIPAYIRLVPPVVPPIYEHSPADHPSVFVLIGFGLFLSAAFVGSFVVLVLF